MALQLASSGDDIKIWECEDFVLANQFNPHNDTVGSVCWAADNSFLASGSLHSEDVVLTDMKTNNTSNIKCGGCLCLDVNDTSRYMLTGASNGIVSVWDLKTSKIRKTYKDHKGPVTSAKFNDGSTTIAAGSETGEIILYNVVTGQGCRPLVTKNIQAIQQVQFSRNKKSLLGSVSDDGSVNLWDCNTRQLAHSFACHQAPSTGLSFSPVNEIFLISVGLDKKITCLDLQKKKIVKSINVDAPLTSVDTMSNGFGIAVGSTRGKIFHYDLRMGSVPVKILDAHKTSVRQLRFQMEMKSDSYRSTSPVNKALKQRQLPASPRNFQESNARISAQSQDLRPGPSVNTDVFSPLREGYLDGSGGMTGYGADGMATYQSPTITSKPTQDDMFSGGVFSPLQDGNYGRDSGSVGLSPLAFPDYALKDQNRNNNSNSGTDHRTSNGDMYSHSTMSMPLSQSAEPLDTGHYSNGGGVSVGSELAASSNYRSPLTSAREVTAAGQSSGYRSRPDVADMPQKHVVFRTEDPDTFTWSSDGSSYTGSSYSPEFSSRARSSDKPDVVVMSASPVLSSRSYDTSPPSAYRSVPSEQATSASRNAKHSQARTPDGVNPQSGLINHMDNNSHSGPLSSVSSSQGVSVSSAAGNSDSVNVNVSTTQIAKIVRTVVKEEMGVLRRELRDVVKEEVEELTQQIAALGTRMKDELDDLMYDLHRDIIHLQGVLIMEFQAQQNDLVKLLEYYSVNDTLVSEVNRLQAEVKQTKHIF